ncbi:MAG: UDP-N-acetylmuramoyl-L-alanine--D-glutamate ligase [Endomicrobiales bacterium]
MKKYMLSGKTVGVMGLARSGIAAANLARSRGAKVLVSELRPRNKCRSRLRRLNAGIAVEFGAHTERLLASDILIKSPGVHHNEILERAAKKGIPVWGEVELALRVSKPGVLVAITGTNGKTTTTALTGGIFKAAGRPTVVGGNIGSPLASAADSVDSRTVAVLEMSSYQLEDSPSFHPHIAAILNITPDHLEHHGTMKNYAGAKAGIFLRQSKKDFSILNYDDPYCRRLAKRCPGKVVFFSRRARLKEGVYFADGRIVVRLPGREGEIPAEMKIPGMHNVENALAAAAMAVAGGVPLAVVQKVLRSFPGVAHRIEFARELDGVRYYNDSKATNVDSTRVALESFPGNVWLILGGRDKGAPYTPLKQLVRERVKGILLIGEAAPLIRKDLAGTVPFFDCGTMEKALSSSRSKAGQGDVVLLSPACASFDQFKDYEERGRHFKKLVRALA